VSTLQRDFPRSQSFAVTDGDGAVELIIQLRSDSGYELFVRRDLWGQFPPALVGLDLVEFEYMQLTAALIPVDSVIAGLKHPLYNVLGARNMPLMKVYTGASDSDHLQGMPYFRAGSSFEAHLRGVWDDNEVRYDGVPSVDQLMVWAAFGGVVIDVRPLSEAFSRLSIPVDDD
jgi:hypothetical protein